MRDNKNYQARLDQNPFAYSVCIVSKLQRSLLIFERQPLFNGATVAWTVNQQFFFATQRTISSINMVSLFSFLLVFSWNDLIFFQGMPHKQLFCCNSFWKAVDFPSSTFSQSFCHSAGHGQRHTGNDPVNGILKYLHVSEMHERHLNGKTFRWIWVLKRTGGIHLNAS